MIRVLFAVTAAVVISGCALFPAIGPGDQVAWQARQANLETLDSWQLQARVASGAVLGWSANMNWRQQAEHFDVRVAGPLGSGGFLARGTPNLVEIKTPEQTVVTVDPEQLLLERVGWAFPLQRLPFWVRGIPDPNLKAQIQVDGQGRLIELRQDGWLVEYDEYGEYDARQLPRKFSMENEQVKIRVVIDRWSGLG